MRMTIRSRIHAGRVRISEFHPWGKVMKVIHLRRIPAFFILKSDKFAHVKILFILTPPALFICWKSFCQGMAPLGCLRQP